jgi:2-dehydro-3-deoxy-D-arabinonate dehydratase
MHLAKIRYGTWPDTVALVEDGQVTPLSMNDRFGALADLLEADDVPSAIGSLARRSERLPVASVTLLPPIDRQEVWAAGVTYKRSKVARMEESQGAARFYDLVYEAARPELFFKASPHRVAGPGQPVRIRGDATWNVPEPELTLVLNSRMRLVGFTIGNDMSSRDIEGENPLYLPQAKVYNSCCGLGPWITLAGDMPPRNEIGIQLAVKRAGKVAFHGETSIEQMARTFEDLVGWLARDNSFPDGVFLLTGTGIVPKEDFTLEAGDVVEITIDGIGTLSNPVIQK